ncbi:Npt1/Npt2 family nucleotide transporter [Rickettsia endosymbiont of Cardiosporidium cionae]|uniref:Npt1/Npt2 family nucleotide transporter n=1 Tax=Rickettsia endosymbiont of Cardiosporidium cionae TaxID=2777155 RepID=UPI0018937E1B|nr:Npt1/Npt2 family nucleotide transporter [Rickettsia endosymbiont of Cardiosporidium cionae]KAF8818428.1 pyruvate, phosphate dikinase [Rickettsia endosymbiont of Cardiosporidium cionae]
MSNNIQRIVDYVWPIKRTEIHKFLLITLLMFCILFIQNLIRAMKDSVVTTLIGAETSVFLKSGAVLPIAFLVTIVYIKMIHSIKSEYIFYIIMFLFLAFFALFAFILFPNHYSLVLDTSYQDSLIIKFPNLKWFILLISNWHLSLFYVISELWSNVVFALLFWQFVNQITDVEESKRFYPLFGLFGQTGLYISGEFLQNLAKINDFFSNKFHLKSDYNVTSIQIVISVVLIIGIITVLVYYIIVNTILTKNSININFVTNNTSDYKLYDSIVLVLKSKYIMLITLMLICYGVSINLVEGPWKAQASQVYTTPTEFAIFIGKYISYTGILTIMFVLVCSNLVRRFGWGVAAMLTPIVVMVTGVSFFLVSNFDKVASLMIISVTISNPVILSILIGTVQNILSKSIKYSLFDSTKEMAYVPLDNELKIKGKVVADIIGVKFGKSLGALFQTFIFIVIPSANYQSISLFLMIIFTLVCIIWIYSVYLLNKEYKIAVMKLQKQ